MGNLCTLDEKGAELYYEYVEDYHSGPTVLFESGYGWDLENWQPIREGVSRFASMVFYDRDSVGQSGKSNKPKHSLQAVENLRVLLEKAAIKPPYILVGHSYGGVNVRLYASLYPEDVKGVILLDSVHENQNCEMVPLFTEEVQEEYLGQFTVESSLVEFEESLEQVRGTNLGNIPLIVMTGGTQPHHTAESMLKWMEFQKDLAKLSTACNHIIVKEAGHAIHIDSPEQVIQAIKTMVDMKY